MVGASYFDNSITWYIMEVREDGLVLKTKRGDIVEHCPYDGIVNMTFSPKTKIICIWKRSEGLTQWKKYHTKKVILFLFFKWYWAISLFISLFYQKLYRCKNVILRLSARTCIAASKMQCNELLRKQMTKKFQRWN